MSQKQTLQIEVSTQGSKACQMGSNSLRPSEPTSYGDKEATTSAPVEDVPTKQYVCVIFSKDRPLQLDGTLRSLQIHCKDIGEVLIQVLYLASELFFQKSYDSLITTYADCPYIRFHQEENFKSDLLFLLTKRSHVLFLVDDNIFVRPFNFVSIRNHLSEHNDAIGFSLRLGENTTYCYPLDVSQRSPEFLHLKDGTLKYRWPGEDQDFGYPLEVSSSVYRTDDVIPLLLRIPFQNPNTLESAMNAEKDTFMDKLPYLLCPPLSLTFCSPINKVQNVAETNRAGSKMEHSPTSLVEAFHAGKRIDVPKYTGFVPNGCHQEVPLYLIDIRRITPRVSIVIPCFNQACFLPEAVASVVTQTYNDWECIIVNDGSTDETNNVARQLIAKYPNHRIELYEKLNGGLSDARNFGIAKSSGEYILPLDADDILNPNMLNKTVALLDSNPEVSIAYTDLIHFGATHRYVQAAEYNFAKLIHNNQLNYCSLYRREVWKHVGGYNCNMVIGYEDWDFWIGCGEHGFQARRIPEPLLLYRVKDCSMFTKALEHDAELRARIILNHPILYDTMTVASAASLLKGKGYDAHKKVPLVSVIIPTYNRPDMLPNTLRSILAQSYPNIEIILVNDASEGVKKLVKEVAPKAIYIRHECNKGLAGARNTGIRHASGKYIAYLDDDDIFYPQHVEILVTFLEQNEYKVAYTDAYRAHQVIDKGRYVISKRDIPYSYDFDYDAILVNNFVPVLCFMHEKSCIEATEWFDENLTTHEDWDLWIRMSRLFKFAHIPSVTCEFTWRIDGSSMTSSKQEDFVRTTRIIYEKSQELVEGNHQIKEVRFRTLSQREANLRNFSNRNFQKSEDSAPNTLATNKALDKARQLLNDGKYDQALTRYHSLLRTDPTSVRALIGIGVIHLITSNFSEASITISKALDHEPNNAKVLCGLGMTKISQGLKTEGIHYFVKALETDPENLTALNELIKASNELIKASYDLQKFEEAISCTRNYLKDHPADQNILFSFAGVLYKSGEYDEARDVLERLLALSPEFEGARELLAKILAKQSHSSSYTDYSTSEHQLFETSETYVQQGRKNKDEGKFAKALEYFSKALELGDSRVLSDMGDCKANLGEYAEAERLYAKVLKHIPDNVAAHVGMGVVRILQGKHSKASVSFNKALKLDPANAKALCGLGMVRNEQGKQKDALKCFSRALDVDPENMPALHELVKCAYGLNQFDEAEKYLSAYLSHSPEDLDMQFTLAGVRVKAKNYHDALEDVENILASAPDYSGGEELRSQIITKLAVNG